MTMNVSSPAFTDGSPIPKRYTCDGEDISPSLMWSGGPGTTRSFALVCDDPDAPAGPWYHWGAYDIPANVSQLQEAFPVNAQVEAIRQAINDFGKAGYSGPCPPHGHGIHHYRFRLLALDVDRLELGARPNCRRVVGAARGHILAWGKLIGTYSR